MERAQVLGEENISLLLRRFSMPAIVGMVVNALYNVIDSMFVGQGVGELGLAAVSAAFPVMMLLMAFGMLIGLGAGTAVSIRLGEKNKAAAELLLGNAVFLAVFFACLSIPVMLAFLEPILLVLGAAADVLPCARDFIGLVLWGNGFVFVSMGLTNIAQAEGNPRAAMLIMVAGAVVNVLLNPLFIFGMHMGMSGSALATVFSQGISAVLAVLYFLSNKSVLQLRWLCLPPDRATLTEIVKNGIPPFLMQIVASGVIILFNYHALRYGGELALAAIGIIHRLMMLIIMPVFGISQGVRPILGYNYGAKRFDRVMEALRQSIVASSLVTTIGFVVIQLFDRQIIALFNNDDQLVLMGAAGLKMMLFMLPVIGFQVIGATYFQAVGKAGWAAFLVMARQVVLLIPLLLVLPGLFGIVGIWLAVPLSDALAALLTGFCLFFDVRKLGGLHQPVEYKVVE